MVVNQVSSATNPAKSVLGEAPRTFNVVEMAERRAKGCDEPFVPGHQLKHRETQLFVMEMDEEEPLAAEETVIEGSESQLSDNAQFDCPQLSMNALNGVSNYQTMRVSGLHNKKLLQILIDS